MYIIANTSTKNQQLYAFDSLRNAENINYHLIRIDSLVYDYDGSIILTEDTLHEIKNNGIPVFETLKEAKKAYNTLGINTCRYVKLVLDFTHEFKSRALLVKSTWTALNNKKAPN